MSSQRTVALEGLFASHRRSITAAFRATGANPDDADDLAGEVFARAVSGYHRLEDAEQASAWLFGIVRNVRREFIRRRRPPAPEIEGVARGEGPLDGQLQQERRNAVRRAVESLDGSQRQVVELRYRDGLPYAQIAEKLEISVEAVGVTLFRAREKLRGRLAQWRTIE